MIRKHTLYRTLITLAAVFIFLYPVSAQEQLNQDPVQTVPADGTIDFPRGSLFGGASDDQIREIARIMVDANRLTMEGFLRADRLAAGLEQQIINLNKDFEREILTVKKGLRLIENISKVQGAGEISLFFPLGSSRLDRESFEFTRLIGFLDALARESRGKKILFTIIGSASAIGKPDFNAALAEDRARAPVDIIDRYLVNIPHEYFKIYGVGDLYSPVEGPAAQHERYQYTRIIAAFDVDGAKDPSPHSGPIPAPTSAAMLMKKSPTKDRPPQSMGVPFVNTIGMMFVYIPAGHFGMGSPSEELGRDSDETRHQVDIENDFFMQNTEVTQGQWKTVMGDNPSFFKDCGDDCPVNRVSWNDAQKFISRLNILENSDKYRLPHESEWEYACRAGSHTAFPNGDLLELICNYDKNLDSLGWYRGNSEFRIHPAARKIPNAWGLFDMHGNVWEWCANPQRLYPLGRAIGPATSAGGLNKIIRGGSWSSDDRDCRSANRLSAISCYKNGGIGFRVVRDL